jgi:hypothetical protein
MKRSAPKTAYAAALAQTADPQGEESLDDMRRRLTRRLIIMVGEWRQCRRGVCRRGRACVPKESGCRSPRGPRRELTPEQEADAIADLRRKLLQRMAELGPEEA